MSEGHGGDKYIIDQATGKVLAVREEGLPELPAREAIDQCARIRAFLIDQYRYDDTIPLAEAVIQLFSMVESKVPLVASASTNGGHEP